MRLVDALAAYALPLTVTLSSLPLLFSRRTDFSRFTLGAEQSGRAIVSVLPTLVGLLVAVSMFSASGLPTAIGQALLPLLSLVGIPGELLPLLVLRPFSGSGGTALLLSLFSDYGVDSYLGFLASILLGSSDTLVYVLSVYFGSVGVRRARYAYPAAILTMLFCTGMTLIVGGLLFT